MAAARASEFDLSGARAEEHDKEAAVPSAHGRAQANLIAAGAGTDERILRHDDLLAEERVGPHHKVGHFVAPAIHNRRLQARGALTFTSVHLSIETETHHGLLPLDERPPDQLPVPASYGSAAL